MVTYEVSVDTDIFAGDIPIFGGEGSLQALLGEELATEGGKQVLRAPQGMSAGESAGAALMWNVLQQGCSKENTCVIKGENEVNIHLIPDPMSKSATERLARMMKRAWGLRGGVAFNARLSELLGKNVVGFYFGFPRFG